MKSKFFRIILILALIDIPVALSQIPQGFNYQAIVHDGTGNPVVNYSLPVRITIQSDSLGGTVFWQELHSTVTTNGSGVFSLVVGKGVREAASGAAVFSDIDWSVTPKFIRTDVDYNGWKLMGSSRLWSVPFSMAAGNISGSLKKLTVEGTTANMDESLFEVRNKNGQTVFAVYNEGVRIYVADGNAKGVKGGFAIGGLTQGKVSPQDYFIVNRDSIRAYIYDNPLVKPVKGGFAIGGFDDAKGLTNDYLLVSPDSVRVYIDSQAKGAKGVKGGFAIGGLTPAKAASEEYLRVTRDSTRIYINDLPGKPVKGGFAIGGFDNAKGSSRFFDVATDASDIISPSQNRILWYPIKNAFLTGKVLIERPDSVGVNSFASGYESKAKGQYSQALGYQAIARGDYSTAIGKNAKANKINSFAFGEGASANNSQTYAFGKNTIAGGTGSFALGYTAKATGDDSFAIGSGTEAIGTGAFAIGFVGRDSAGITTGNTRAESPWAVSIGMGAQSKAMGAFSIGTKTRANGWYSTALGYQATANGYYSVSIGSNTTSTDFSTAIGYLSTASTSGIALGTWLTATGGYSLALGHGSQATGSLSSAIGSYAKATGISSVAIGYVATSEGMGSFAAGYNTLANGNYSTAMGYETTASGNFSSMAIGYRTTASGSSAFATGNGTIASGVYSTATGYQTTANNAYSTASGNQTRAEGQSSVAMGSQSISRGFASTAVGTSTLAAGYSSLTAGFDSKAYGEGSAAIGWSTVARANGSSTIGNYTVSNSYQSLVVGNYNDTTCSLAGRTSWVSTDPLFIVGAGFGGARRNALTILKNGQIGLQSVISPTYALELPNNSSTGIGQARAYAWTTYSDDRVKTEQATIQYGLTEVMKLTPKSYFHHNSISENNSIEMSPDGEYDLGLIAQDVFKIIPEAVIKPENEEKELWSLSYDKLIPVLIKAIQEQQAIIMTQKSRIDELESLKERIEALELMAGNR